MSNIHEHLDQIDQELAKQTEQVVEEANPFDPGVMWTPLIISAMVMIAIFGIGKYPLFKISHPWGQTNSSMSCLFNGLEQKPTLTNYYSLRDKDRPLKKLTWGESRANSSAKCDRQGCLGV